MRSSSELKYRLVEEIRAIEKQMVCVNGWGKIVNEITRHVLCGDDPDTFLRWRPIIKTMHLSGKAPHIPGKLKYLRNLPDFEDPWRNLLVEDSVGNPTTFDEWGWSSGTRIQHIYHLAKFREVTGLNLWDVEGIFEFGGGYGGFARVMNLARFQGKYLIYDMPVMSALKGFIYTKQWGRNQKFLCVSLYWMN